jgi:hypothetical protein
MPGVRLVRLGVVVHWRRTDAMHTDFLGPNNVKYDARARTVRADRSTNPKICTGGVGVMHTVRVLVGLGVWMGLLQ